jgi:uncharacterized protein (TIGR04255 family)
MTPVARASERQTTSSNRRHYARAPVIQSSAEIRVARSEPVLPDALRRLGDDEGGRYPDVKELVRGDVQITVEPAAAPPLQAATHGEITGFEWANPAERFRAQSAGLSYHRLEPYTSWESCRDELRRLWPRYRALSAVQRIERIGLRYVNRLNLPAGAEIKDYLLTVPDVAPRLPQALSGYMMQLNIPHPELPGGVLVIREGLMQPTSADVTSVLLDLDLFQTVDFAPDTDDVWNHFETLHAYHNEAFESCITDRTREMIS